MVLTMSIKAKDKMKKLEEIPVLNESASLKKCLDLMSTKRLGIACFVGETLIMTLPGSPRGAEESMDAVFPYILHVFRVREGVRHN